MPVAYLHIGSHKTGTTAVQVFLRDHPDWLAQHGIVVPSSQLPNDSTHHALARAIAGLPSVPGHANLPSLLAEELRTLDGRNILLSSETLESLMQHEPLARRVVSFFAELGYRVETLCWLRPQVSAWNSGYAQQVKTLHRTETFADNVATRLERMRKQKPLWRQLEGMPGLRARFFAYDTGVRREGAVAALVRALGIADTPPAAGARVNAICGPLEVFVCRHLARVIAADRAAGPIMHRRNALLGELRRHQLGEAETFWGVTPEISSRIDQATAAANEDMARALWGRPWRECFADEPDRNRIPNDLDLHPEVRQSERVRGLLLMAEDAWQRIRPLPEPEIDRPLTLREALVAAGFETDGDKLPKREKAALAL